MMTLWLVLKSTNDHRYITKTFPSSILFQPCWVIRQGSPQEALIAPMFVEDPLPTSGSPGFLEYMQVLQRDVLSK